MKLKLFTAGAAMSLLLLTACSGGAPEGKSAANAGLKTMEDSVSYYMGMALSGGYNQMAQGDTTLKTEAARAEVLKAFGETMKSFEGKSDAELAGIAMALQTLMQNKQISENLEVNFNNQLLASGLAYAMTGDSISARSAEGSQYVQAAFMRLQSKQSEKYKAAVAKKMPEFAKKGYNKVADNLYMKSVKAGTGAQLKDGDKVKIKMTAKDAAGKALNLPMPESAVVGQMFMGTPLAQSFSQMKMGETAEFVTGAFDMFQNPQQVKKLGLDPAGVVIFSIEAIGMDDSTPAKGATVQAQPAKVTPADAPKAGASTPKADAKVTPAKK